MGCDPSRATSLIMGGIGRRPVRGYEGAKGLQKIHELARQQAHSEHGGLQSQRATGQAPPPGISAAASDRAQQSNTRRKLVGKKTVKEVRGYTV